MGSRKFCVTGTGEKVEDVFNELVEVANREYGNSIYSVHINAGRLFGRADKVYDKCTPEVEKEVSDYLSSHVVADGRVAHYIDLGVIGYELIEVKRENRKSDAKFEMMYNVYNYSGKRVASEKVKAAAESAAMKYSVEHNENTFIQKEPNRASGSCLVCDVSVSRKFYEKKPRIPRGPGKELVAIHKYIFYGWAAC